MRNLVLAALAYVIIGANAAPQSTAHPLLKTTDLNVQIMPSGLVKTATSQLCCKHRESCDSGRRICPVYRIRSDSCNKDEETVAMLFCKGP